MSVLNYLLVFVILTADLLGALYQDSILPLPSLGVFIYTSVCLVYIVCNKKLKPSVSKGVFWGGSFVIFGLILSSLSSVFNIIKILHLMLYFLFMLSTYSLYRRNYLNQWKVVDLLINVVATISLFYVLLTLLANANLIVDLAYLIKIYPEHGVVRVAFLFNEPLLMGLNFVIFLTLAEWRERRKWVSGALILGVLSTLSLSSYVLLFVYLFIKNIRLNLTSLKTYFVLATFVLLIIGMTIVLKDRINNILLLEDGSTRIRLALTISSFMMFLDNWATGVGWGNSGEKLSEYGNIFSSSVNMELSYSSNLYLSILSELGILGIIPFCIFIYFIIKSSKSDRGLMSGCLVVLLSFFQQALLLYPAVWFFWVVILTKNLKLNHVSKKHLSFKLKT